ncbi:putative ATP-dependent RNA helicase TDRD12 [Bombina bombina]|uniref:putative ATP-dependent RNA helicase TDRD12 n=1 Tax=Bombina bombina TaxID=8345 RepID=UPI00235A8B48|nr:putative ATP-dependent RNA helicase TDRD12 [Bombina bombina]
MAGVRAKKSVAQLALPPLPSAYVSSLSEPGHDLQQRGQQGEVQPTAPSSRRCPELQASQSECQVVDPSCFWCQILKGNDLLIYDNKEYEHLFEELNTLYEKYYRDVEDLKPSSLPIGEVCMVFCKDSKSWCRATLESSVCSAENELIECFLPDYAVYVPVEKKNVRLAVEACQRLPFRTKKFKLHQVQPVSLDIDFIEDTAEIG